VKDADLPPFLASFTQREQNPLGQLYLLHELTKRGEEQYDMHSELALDWHPVHRWLTSGLLWMSSSGKQRIVAAWLLLGSRTEHSLMGSSFTIYPHIYINTSTDGLYNAVRAFWIVMYRLGM